MSAAVDFWGLPFSLGQRFVLRLVVEGMVSACVVLPQPLLLKTVLREKRDAFMLDEDVDAMLRGRLLGIAGGLWVGATINSMMF
ncbi:hypothetical protein [Paraburkholderia susongensis]|nr:hypothetical protein [Paraburkholderia susongensis]